MKLIIERKFNLSDFSQTARPSGIDVGDSDLFFATNKILPAPHSRQATRAIKLVLGTDHEARRCCQPPAVVPESETTERVSGLWEIKHVGIVKGIHPIMYEVLLIWSGLPNKNDPTALRANVGFPEFRHNGDECDLVCYSLVGDREFTYTHAELSQAAA